MIASLFYKKKFVAKSKKKIENKISKASAKIRYSSYDSAELFGIGDSVWPNLGSVENLEIRFG